MSEKINWKDGINNNKEVLIISTIYLLIAYFWSDSITAWIASLHPIWILIFSTFLDPLYLVFLYLLSRWAGWKGTIAAFILGIISGLTSMPHLYLRTGEFSQDSINLIYDKIFYNLVPKFLDININIPFDGVVSLRVLIIYFILPLIGIFFTLFLTRKKFVRIFKQSV